MVCHGGDVRYIKYKYIMYAYCIGTTVCFISSQFYKPYKCEKHNVE